MKKRKTSAAIMNRKRREVLDFARDYNLVIHPGKGYDYYIQGYFMFSHCPCDSSRLDCPCPESLEEIEKEGHCKCRLFWRDFDIFKEKFISKEE